MLRCYRSRAREGVGVCSRYTTGGAQTGLSMNQDRVPLAILVVLDILCEDDQATLE